MFNVSSTLRLAIGACLVLLSGASGALAAETKQPHLKYALSPKHPDILVMIWRGRIQAPMSEEIASAFEKHMDHIRGVTLKLDSDGGSVREGERAIAVLQEIKKTHELHTAVGPGQRCGSMCVFIYVQGSKRLAAPASIWLFHEVSVKDPVTHKVAMLDRKHWEQLVDKYWVPAGVNQTWIAYVKEHTYGTNFWEAGEALLRDGANIIQLPMSNEQKRSVTARPPNDSPPPSPDPDRADPDHW